MEGKTKRRARTKTPEPAGGPAAAEILAAEIATLRDLMRRVARLAEPGSSEEADLELLQILNSFSLASARLVTLLKAQRGLGSEDPETTFFQALEGALQDLEKPNQERLF
jgi:hypothetical protein